jgi:hypothetical protein
MTVQDCDDLGVFLEDARYRRSWLLIKASHCAPLDRALDLAKRCEEFITGAAGEQSIGSAAVPGDATASPGNEQPQPCPAPAGTPDGPTTPRATRPSLSAPERERLLGRLAEGAKNAELAAELGLSPKQVQGIRMGCAREIRRRGERREIEKETSNAATITASIDDVVRYLRQRDDVVVPQAGGDFLVNARFRLPVADLVTRANRMRARQGKPEFELHNRPQAAVDAIVAANGHRSL